MSIDQSTLEREDLCLPGRSAEPVVSEYELTTAIEPDDVEWFRPLLPMGYRCVADAYRTAANHLTARDLSTHYTDGVSSFQKEFVPFLKTHLRELSGGVWNLDDYVAFAAGSDVDLMTHIIEGVSSREVVCLYPGDWYGFYLGSTHATNMEWRETAEGSLACLCVPSVRNGHLTSEMVTFLESASSCLLNLNLYPTLRAEERTQVATALNPHLDKSILSISFSRGYGLTASQLGVILLHRDHPYCKTFADQWNWLTYFYNSLAAKAFMNLDLKKIAEVDEERRQWVERWLRNHSLPTNETGTYYVKTYRVEEELPPWLAPLERNGLIRLCFKPPVT